MYHGLTLLCIVLIDLPFGSTFRNLCCCAMRSVNLCHEFQRTIAVHQTMWTSKNGTAIANCFLHFSVQDRVPSSIFAWSSFSTRCPSQKYLLQKARQLSLGVRFRTGSTSCVSLGSACLGLRAAMMMAQAAGQDVWRDALAAEDGLEVSQLAADVGDLGLPATAAGLPV